LQLLLTRGKAITEEHAGVRIAEVRIALLREINLAPIRPFNKLSKGVSHTHANRCNRFGNTALGTYIAPK